MIRAHWLLIPLLVAGLTIALLAGEMPVSVTDSFNLLEGRPLREGDWLEYRIAFPVDPLENSLSPNRIAPHDDGHIPMDAAFPGVPSGSDRSTQPAFKPPAAWRVLPLRVEVMLVEEEGCRIHLTLNGLAGDVFLPLRRPESPSPFRYEAPQAEDATGIHIFGDTEYPVQIIRRQDPRGGFVRLSNPDLPFGLARFATDNVDLSLVGMGKGAPPGFPLPETEVHLVPAPGLLYRDE